MSQQIDEPTLGIVQSLVSQKKLPLVDFTLNSVLEWKDSQGKAILHHATEEGVVGLVHFLISNGADIAKYDEDGYAPIHYAMKTKHLEIIKLFVQQKEDIVNYPTTKECTHGGFTALHWAADLPSSSGLAEFILDCKATDVDRKDSMGRTALHWACAKGSLPTVKLLLQHDANPDALDDEMKTPLIMAAQAGKPEIIEHLIKNADVDPNLQDKSGDTVLHHAAEIQLQRLIYNYNWHMNPTHAEAFYTLLVNSEADPTILNRDEDTPLDIIDEPLANIFEVISDNKESFKTIPKFYMIMKKEKAQLLELGVPEDEVDMLLFALAEYHQILSAEGSKSACNYIDVKNIPRKRKFAEMLTRATHPDDPPEINALGEPMKCPFGFSDDQEETNQPHPQPTSELLVNPQQNAPKCPFGFSDGPMPSYLKFTETMPLPVQNSNVNLNTEDIFANVTDTTNTSDNLKHEQDHKSVHVDYKLAHVDEKPIHARDSESQPLSNPKCPYTRTKAVVAQPIFWAYTFFVVLVSSGVTRMYFC